MEANRLLQQFLYWGVWLVIPLLWEIVTGLVSAVIVTIKYFRKKKETIDYYPDVTILIPVYESQTTLRACLMSIVDQDYPKERIEVFLIDNGSKDESFAVFTAFQEEYPDVKAWWYNSEQGKSKALNKGIFASIGKYVVNIDSDGCLHKSAIQNIVRKFENNNNTAGVTGVVLTDPDMVRMSQGRFLRLLRTCELFEYTESFLLGRNFQSKFNSIYTLAGAFSAFRREALLKTQMYNSETLGEDTHMTFQIRSFAHGKIELCEDAYFFVDPIEGLDKLYTQRQRWQRAELEVASLFTKDHLGNIFDFITKAPMRRLVSDHTLSFPRLIWFFAMIYLYFINYPLSLLIGANLLLYLSYVVNGFIYMGVSVKYLKEHEDVRGFLLKHWYICLLMPAYRFLIYWIRIAGTINSLTTESQWRTKTLSEEFSTVRTELKEKSTPVLRGIEFIRRYINNG